MKRIKKTAAVLSAVSAVTLLLAGCGSKTGGSNGATTVTVWSWRSQDAPLWKEVQTALNKKGDNIKIQFRSVKPTSYDSVVKTAMNGGKGPDIFYARAGEGTLDYAAANMIAPVNKFVDLSNINKGAMSAVQYKGKDYGVPFALQTMEVFYNKKMFKKYNLTVPQTWSQFIQICKTLKSHSVTPISAMGIQSWMLALNFDEVGATMMSDSFTQKLVNKQANYTSAPYVNALAKYQQLGNYFEPNFKAVGSGGSEQETQFATGQSAMVMDGIFDVPTIQKDNPNLQLGAFLIPPATSSQKAKIDWYTDGDIVMNSSIKNKAEMKAAKEILAFTATTQFGQDFSNIAGEISPIKGVKVPSKYPLSVQAYKWYQTRPINPIFGIRSPMDTPPPTPVNSKKKQAANTDTGIFSAEQKVLLPLLTKQITPKQAAAKVQKMVSWYFQ